MQTIYGQHIEPPKYRLKLMIDAGEKIREALAEQGFAPR